MSANGHVLFGLSMVAATAASIWISVAIPTHDEAQAREQIKSLVARVEQVPGAGACPASDVSGVGGEYLGKTTVNNKTCAITMTLRDSAPVAGAIRGSTIVLTYRQGGRRNEVSDTAERLWSCTASGGHGALPSDFPPDCRYRVTAPLL